MTDRKTKTFRLPEHTRAQLKWIQNTTYRKYSETDIIIMSVGHYARELGLKLDDYEDFKKFIDEYRLSLASDQC